MATSVKTKSLSAKYVVQELIERMASKDPRMRHGAAIAIGVLGPDARAAIPALKQLANDRTDLVAKAAREALEYVDRDTRNSRLEGSLDNALIGKINKGLEKAPANPLEYLASGQAYFNNHEWELAIEDLGKCIESSKSYPLSSSSDDLDPVARAYYLRARAYLENGDDLSAFDDINTAIESYKKLKDPTYAEALELRGKMHLAKDNYETAIIDYSKAIAVNDKSATAYLGRSIAYEKLGDTENAEADKKRFTDLFQAK